MHMRVADEAWLATALLHKEHPDSEDFKLSEIHDRARREFHDERPGVWYHIVSHCVASNPPSPAQYRMLHETGRGRRRLFRPGDPTHSERKGKTHPEKDKIPPKYHGLVDWYVSEYSKDKIQSARTTKPEFFLKFVGAISAFDLQKMKEAIEEGCERVEPNEW
jgi:hypothetical protein